ncbi:hypothetical protein AVO41_01010 [Thiomicrospira sp. WB1]|nr:hypothetical protein AVO41_01010 [Thiomicrospira sp. WB1]
MFTLFGEAKNQDEVEQGAGHDYASLEESNLSLTLVGLISHPVRPVALIAQSGQVETYVPGEEIAPNVELIAVHGQFVVLDEKGQKRKLSLPFETTQRVKPSSREVPPLFEKNTPAHHDELSKMGHKIKKDPMTLNRFLRFKPTYNNGLVTGVKIWPREKAALFQALGLRAADEVIAVNGLSVSELFQAPQKWAKLLNHNRFDLTLRRTGRTHQVTFNLS